MDLVYNTVIDCVNNDRGIDKSELMLMLRKSRNKVKLLHDFLNSNLDKSSIIHQNFDLFCGLLSPLEQIKNVPQNNKWHIGDVYTHTMYALSLYKGTDWVISLAVLLHDVGKKQCRCTTDGIDHFYGHPEASYNLVKQWGSNQSWGIYYRDYIKLCQLIKYHDYALPTTINGVRRLDYKFRELGIRLEDWMDLRECDILAHRDYDVLYDDLLKCRDLVCSYRQQETITNLYKSMPINGNDIKELGYSGREVGRVLDFCFKLYKDNTDLSGEELLSAVKSFFNN